MSGGVDSSVALYLAQKAGYDCIGVTMKLYDGKVECAGKKTCCSLSDVEDARSVATNLDIPFYVFDYKDEFRRTVIEKFLREYENGFTPNPCIDCNNYMKFQHLYEQGRELGCDVIVTGHYARVLYNKTTDEYELYAGIDEKKDQSYVLFSLNQEQLKHTFFPLGSYTKDEIRQMANELGMVNACKPDSQDICFVEGGNYVTYLEKMGLRSRKGELVNVQGDVIGTHEGYFHYTIGQRKGLGISGEQSQYVKEIQPENNCVVMGTKEELYMKSIIVGNLTWTSDHFANTSKAANMNAAANITLAKDNDNGFDCSVRCRYHQKLIDAHVILLSDRRCVVNFREPVYGIAPGQAAVFYLGDKVLGGGTIQRNNLKNDCQPN